MAGHPLDNPVWNALAGPHRALAVPAGRFLRYREDVALFAGAADPAQGFGELGVELPAGTMVGLVTANAVAIPEGMEVVEVATVPQMVADTLLPVAPRIGLVLLGHQHVPAMLELTELTQPGPFLERTIEMGGILESSTVRGWWPWRESG